MITTTTTADRGGAARRRRGRLPASTEKQAARLIAAAAAVAGGWAGCRPTGTALVDPVLTAGLAALVTMASSRASRWPLFAPAIAAIAVSEGWALVPSIASSVTAMAGARQTRRSRLWGAATGGLAVQALLRLPDVGFHGATALITAAAVTPVLVSGYRKCRRRERRWVRRLAVASGVVVVVIGAAYGALLLTVAGDADRAVASTKAGLNSTRQGQTDDARASFARAEESFQRVERRVNGWWAAPARAVPVLAQHARSTGSVAEQGVELGRAAGETVVMADYQELRYDSGQFDLDRIASVRAPLAQTARSIARSLRAIDADRSPWLVAPFDDALTDLRGELVDARDEAELALEAVEVAPQLLGGDGPRRYLVVFVTPVEQRGSGGFIGSFAELSAADGRLRLVRSGSVAELVVGYPADDIELTGLEEYRRRYDRYNVGDFRDLTFSPHFPYVAEAIRQVYPQVGGAPLDGVISMDPIGLAALLEFTGPVRIEGFGRTLTADDAADFLLVDNYSLFPDGEAQNDALAELVEITFDRLTTGDLPGPRRIGKVLGPMVADGRIRLWSPDDAEQALFDRLGATGAFPEAAPDRDFLTVAGQNGGPNKIDAYQRRTIDYQVHVDDQGALRATATVTVFNDAPVDGSVAAYIINNDDDEPTGTMGMQISVYSPHGLNGATIDGERTGMESQSEAGYHVYSKVISVPPGGSVTLELELEGTLDTAEGYRLDLAPQPTVTSDRLEVRISRGGRAATTIGPLDVLGRRTLVVDE